MAYRKVFPFIFLLFTNCFTQKKIPAKHTVDYKLTRNGEKIYPLPYYIKINGVSVLDTMWVTFAVDTTFYFYQTQEPPK